MHAGQVTKRSSCYGNKLCPSPGEWFLSLNSCVTEVIVSSIPYHFHLVTTTHPEIMATFDISAGEKAGNEFKLKHVSKKLTKKLEDLHYLIVNKCTKGSPLNIVKGQHKRDAVAVNVLHSCGAYTGWYRLLAEHHPFRALKYDAIVAISEPHHLASCICGILLFVCVCVCAMTFCCKLSRIKVDENSLVLSAQFR